MRNGYTINQLAKITNTPRSTLISWIASGRVAPPTENYPNMQNTRYSEETVQQAIEQIGKCKHMPHKWVLTDKPQGLLKATMTIKEVK